MIRIPRRAEEGYVMVTALIALAVMAILAAVAISQANSALRMSGQAVRSEQALYMANAGVEMILARAKNDPASIEELTPYTYTLLLEPGLVGSYEVVVALRPSSIFIHSTGRVTRDGEPLTSRVVEAEIPLTQGDDSGGGDGGNGGDGGGGAVSDQLVFGNGPLSLMNSADVCGDLYASGDMTLGNGVTVWAKTKAQDPDSPCDAIQGTGKAVASGTLTKGNKTEIQGGWCDSTHFGSPYPCESQPQVRAFPAPDWAKLKAEATRWYVKPADAAFCNDKPAGTCQVLAGNPPKLDLYGEATYNNQLIFIDGDLEVPRRANRELVVSGTVTFAATGEVSLGGNVRCAGGSNCTVAFIAGGDLVLGNNKEVWAVLQTQGTLSGNQMTIHGYLAASSYDLKNGMTLYPLALTTWPPGVPGGSTTPGSGGSTTAQPPGYSDWNQ
ncbi:MAG: type IV pilus modification PilV family protein [Bacillota bacterium]